MNKFIGNNGIKKMINNVNIVKNDLSKRIHLLDNRYTEINTRLINIENNSDSEIKNNVSSNSTRITSLENNMKNKSDTNHTHSTYATQSSVNNLTTKVNNIDNKCTYKPYYTEGILSYDSSIPAYFITIPSIPSEYTMDGINDIFKQNIMIVIKINDSITNHGLNISRFNYIAIKVQGVDHTLFNKKMVLSAYDSNYHIIDDNTDQSLYYTLDKSIHIFTRGYVVGYIDFYDNTVSNTKALFINPLSISYKQNNVLLGYDDTISDIFNININNTNIIEDPIDPLYSILYLYNNFIKSNICKVRYGLIKSGSETISLDENAMYLLCATEITISTGKMYGMGINIYGTGVAGVNPTALNTIKTTNRGSTISLVASPTGITIKANTNYHVRYVLYKIFDSNIINDDNVYWNLK